MPSGISHLQQSVTQSDRLSQVLADWPPRIFTQSAYPHSLSFGGGVFGLTARLTD